MLFVRINLEDARVGRCVSYIIVFIQVLCLCWMLFLVCFSKCKYNVLFFIIIIFNICQGSVRPIEFYLNVMFSKLESRPQIIDVRSIKKKKLFIEWILPIIYRVPSLVVTNKTHILSWVCLKTLTKVPRQMRNKSRRLFHLTLQQLPKSVFYVEKDFVSYIFSYITGK